MKINRSSLARLAGLMATLAVSACSHTFPNVEEGGGETASPDPRAIPVLHVRVIKGYPHDPGAFTQGLEYFEGHLYESTGENGQSSLRKVDLETGKVLQKAELDSRYFGEGLTIFRGKIHQLTWLTNKGFVYDLRSFRKQREFEYYGEGWGLTHDESNLILSDGTNRLRFLDPETFQVTRTLDVYAGKEAVANLNELELVENEIYANIWHSNRIARIDTRSGVVRAWIDCSSLGSREQKEPEAVLNGIAYDAKRRRLFLTGKNWAHLFEVQVEGSTL